VTVAWVAAHPKVRMLGYYQGNQTTSPFRLYRYPKAARVMRDALRSARYTGLPLRRRSDVTAGRSR
jgi:hypothetical protein